MRLSAVLVLVSASALCQQDQTPLPAGTYRAGNGVTPPVVVSKTDPEYSEEARIAKLTGTVRISLVVGTDGEVGDLHAAATPGLGLEDKAIEAVHTWRFKPGMKDGMPVPVLVGVEVNFRLLVERGAWALSRAVFTTPERAARPVLTLAPYPDIYTPAGQTGSVALSFDVEPNGEAANLHIENSSSPALESEVIRIVRGWRFRPGIKDGQTVSVPCTLEFVKENAQ
jgi:TonB family protein